MPTVHKSALKETDSHLELGLKIACHSPPPSCQAGCVRKPERCTPGFPGQREQALEIAGCYRRPVPAGSELPAGSHAEVGSGLPGKHRSRNSPPPARCVIAPALPAPTIAQNPSSALEHPWQRLLLLGEAGVTAAQRSARSRTLSTDSTPARRSMCFTSPTFGLPYLLL